MVQNLTTPPTRPFRLRPLWRPLWRHLCAGRERTGVHSGWALIAWGLSAFLATPDYEGLSRYASPVIWATVPTLYGLLQLWSAIAFGLRGRRRVDIGAAGIWAFLELFLYTSHARVVMLAVIPTFIVSNILSVLLFPAMPPVGTAEGIHAGLVTEEPDALPNNAPVIDAPTTATTPIVTTPSVH